MAKANLEAILEDNPSAGMSDLEWREFFGTAAGEYALGRILYDIYDRVRDDEEKAAGLRRMGRRPAREPVGLHEVYGKVLPPIPSHEDFGVALRARMGRQSVRAFAPRVPMNHSTLSKMMTGKLPVDIETLELVAGVLKVHPSYFMEWRALYVGQLITEVFMENPNLSITAYRALNQGGAALREGRLES